MKFTKQWGGGFGSVIKKTDKVQIKLLHEKENRTKQNEAKKCLANL